MEFKTVEVAAADPAAKNTIEQLQRNISALAQEIPESATEANVQEVDGGATVKIEFSESEITVLVDSRGGPVALVLPNAATRKRVCVLRKYTTNDVTVQTEDAESMG